MEPEKTEGDVITKTNEGEGEAETVSVPKKDYDTLNQTLGSLKRELKDLKKSKEETKETPEKTKTDENQLLAKIEKMSLRQAGISNPDDIKLAQDTAKKWGMDIDDVLADEDFKVKLERQQTARANVAATSGVKGGQGGSQAKNTAEYWIAKGIPPTPNDIPDKSTRQKIVTAVIKAVKQGDNKKFYND